MARAMEAIFMGRLRGSFQGGEANQAVQIYPIDRGGNMMRADEARSAAAY
jgi:hypothetical protein